MVPPLSFTYPPKRTACSLKSCPTKKRIVFTRHHLPKFNFRHPLVLVDRALGWMERNEPEVLRHLCLYGRCAFSRDECWLSVREQKDTSSWDFKLKSSWLSLVLHWVTILNLDFGRCSIESIGIFGLGRGLLINQPTAIKNPAASSDVVITGYPVLKPPPTWYLFVVTPTWEMIQFDLCIFFKWAMKTPWSLFGIYRRLYYPAMLGL